MTKNNNTKQVLISQELSIRCKILSIHKGISRQQVIDEAINQYLEREQQTDEELKGHLDKQLDKKDK
jgi:predicted transcriptional regulator